MFVRLVELDLAIPHWSDEAMSDKKTDRFPGKGMTPEEQRARHMKRLDNPETRKRWGPSYEHFVGSPVILRALLNDSQVYGGSEVREALVTRVEELRSWTEALSFEDWWRFSCPWPRLAEPCAEAGMWRELGVEVHTACNPYLRKEQLIHGHVYAIQSRNLTTGAYNEETGGFNGIRTKFDRRYIFEEYHWDNGPPYGTVHPQADLGPLPEGIEPRESLGTVETATSRLVWWDSEAKSEGHSHGRRRYVDTGEFCDNPAHMVHNDALFAYLDGLAAGKE